MRDDDLVWFRCLRSPRPLCNFLPVHLLSSIPNLLAAVLPLADRHFTFGRRPMISVPIHLQAGPLTAAQAWASRFFSDAE